MKPATLLTLSLALGTAACSTAPLPVAPSTATASTTSLSNGSTTDASPAAGLGAGATLAAVRQATAKYHDVAAAIADGYVVPPADACFEVPGVGAMGLHVFNPQLASDQAVDPLKPEVLLYLPTRNGGLELVGVEYFVPLAGPADPTPRPSVLGESFQGPMAGHEPGMPWHYDLHVWAWSTNPSGTFAQFNPRLSCGTAARQ